MKQSKHYVWRWAIALSVFGWCCCSSVLVRAGLEVQGNTIIDNATGRPIRGFHGMYQAIGSTRAQIEADLDAMKNLFDLKGFNIEIGWNSVEPTRGNFQFPAIYETVLDVAQEKGLDVSIFFTPHYTPDWVYQQGPDVYNKDPNGNSVNGQWLNYAPSSPAALLWQGAFQRTAVEHYKTKPAVISFQLTNELSYGETTWLDYSSYAQQAWNTWRSDRGLPQVTMPKPSEASSRPADWQNWILFRQDQLDTYFNRVYAQARQGLGPNDTQLIFHRHTWYQASDALVAPNGLYLDPNQTIADSTGGNVYGQNENMVAMMQAWRKPMFLTETNDGAIAGSNPPSPGRMNTMFLRQFFQGAQNQNVFSFDVGSYGMRLDNNTPHPSFAQFKAMAEKIDMITAVDLPAQREVGYLWPRNFAAVRGGEYWNLQHLYDDVMREGRRIAQSPVMVYPSFLEANQPSAELIGDLKLIYAMRHYGLDQQAINSNGLRDWVSAGGTLVVELDPNNAPPSWLGVTAQSTSRSTFSTDSSSPFGAQGHISRGEVGWALTNLDQTWATWDKSFSFQPNQSAVGVKNFGQGKVILLGSNNLPNFKPFDGINSFVLGDEDLNANYEYFRLGQNVLATPFDDSVGANTLSVPQSWVGARIEGYLMNNSTGLFTLTRWLSNSAGRYVYNVPDDTLLMLLTITATPGDTDFDGDVDLADLGALATSYGAAGDHTWRQGDFDGDFDVDLSDLGALATNYGAGQAQAFADFQSMVPESTLAGASSVFCLSITLVCSRLRPPRLRFG